MGKATLLLIFCRRLLAVGGSAENSQYLQVVLGQSKTDPAKYVAMKVVYLRSPDVLDDPEHLAILRKWAPSGCLIFAASPASISCFLSRSAQHAGRGLHEGIPRSFRTAIRNCKQAGLAARSYVCPVTVHRVPV